MKSKKIRNVVITAMILTSVVCSVKIFTLANSETYSVFTAKASSTGSVSVIKAEDMLDFKIEECKYSFKSSYGEDSFIVIRPQKELKDNSTFYFEVGGDIDPYILHINPVQISKYSTEMESKSSKGQLNINGERCIISSNGQYFVSEEEEKYYVPIYVEVSLVNKCFDLADKKEFHGNVTLKYLNQFIVDKKDMSLNSKYLIQRGLYGSNADLWNYIKEGIFENNKAVDFSNTSYNLVNFETEGMENQSYMKFDLDTATLNSQQKMIVDIIAKGYTDYVDNLKESILNLEKHKKDLEDKNIVLEDKNKELEVKVNELENISLKLNETIDALQAENHRHNNQLQELNQTINDLLASQKEKIDNAVTVDKMNAETKIKVEIATPTAIEDPNK